MSKYLCHPFAVSFFLISLFLYFRDYRAMPELDRYEAAGLDNEEYGDMAVDQRRAAERELDTV